MKPVNTNSQAPNAGARRVALQPLERSGGGAGAVEQFLFGRVAPQAVPLEAAVLGALMLNRDAMAIVVDILKPASFYRDDHQLIFAAMQQLHGRSQPIDLLTVMEALKKEGKLEATGGPAYLAELTNLVASAANIEYHARIIAQYALNRRIIEAGAELVQQGYDDTVDVFQLLDRFQNYAIELTQEIGGRESSHVSSIAAECLRDLLDNQGQKGIRGVSTGLPALDEITGGLHRSDLIILAARPGMGKTALVLGMAREAALAGIPVQIFSLEMSKKQMVIRQASQISGVSASKILKGTLNQEDIAGFAQAFEAVSELDIYIDDTAGIDILELRAKAKKAKMKHDIGLIIVDYIQQANYSGKDAFNREQAVARIAKELKNLAKELDIPVIALAQLSRAVETRGGTKRPQLSDLRETGQIEQEADLVGFIYRPEYYQILEDEDGQSLKGVAEIIIAKNRHMEPKTARVRWEGEYTRFSDLLDDELPIDDGLLPDPAASAPPTYMIRPSRFNDDEDIPY